LIMPAATPIKKNNIINHGLTKPWLIILFFFIGVAAGIINVVRSAKKMQKD